MDIASLGTRIQGRYRRTVSDFLSRRPLLMRSEVPYISFTFDDFPRSALLTGGAVLQQYKIRGTYYASLGMMGTQAPAGSIFLAEDLKDLLTQGHELGCHTFAHCHAWETMPSVFEESVIQNRCALESILRGYSFRTLSYPIHWPRPHTKRIVAKYFICARSGGQTFNAGTADLNGLSSHFLERSINNPGLVKELIDQTCRARGWLIFSTHDVCSTPSPYGCTPTFFEDIVRYAVNSGAKVLPVAEVCEAIHTRRRSTQ